jgi:hypothetical protein
MLAFFVPVIPNGGPYPSCASCPDIMGFPYYSSVTYTYFGSGTVYIASGYHLIL